MGLADKNNVVAEPVSPTRKRKEFSKFLKN